MSDAARTFTVLKTEGQRNTKHIMKNWTRILGFSAAGITVTALGWFLLRAHTEIFTVLNLRVFVGVIMLLPALGGALLGFDPGLLTKKDPVAIPRAVRGLSALSGMVAVVLGEFIASQGTGVPIPWDKFNLIFLVVCLMLPFKVEGILNKK